jgi:hypothetical protein
MRPYPLAVIAAMLAFLATGCRHSESDDLPATVASPEGTVHLERLGETERVLEHLGQEAWVFKHRGGLLTTEFIVFHRPQGKDQAERVIFRSFGDDVVLLVQDREQRAAGEDERQDEDGGYVIATMPPWPSDGSGEFTHFFSLNGPFGSTTEPANEIYPNTNAPTKHSPAILSGSVDYDEKVELNPGESRELVGLTRLRPATDVPLLELEQIRYVLTVTALQDGQLPKRDGPAIPE